MFLMINGIIKKKSLRPKQNECGWDCVSCNSLFTFPFWVFFITIITFLVFPI